MKWFVGEDGRLHAIWRFALSFVYAFFIASYLAAVAAVDAGTLSSLRFEMVYRPVWMGLLLAGFSLFVVLLDRRPMPLRNMGLGQPWWHDTLKGIAIGGGMVVVGGACIVVLGSVSFSGVLNGRVLLRLLAVVFVLITAAMAEELTFRGYPFQRLLEAAGPIGAIAVMSAMFGYVHLTNPGASATGFVNTVLIGGVLSLAYLRTWRLWLPFGIHLGWNLTLGTILGLPVSGLNEFSIVVVGRARGPAWLTGGAYGMEASLVGTVVILLGFLALKAFVPAVKRPQLVPEAPFSLALDQPASVATEDERTPPQTDADALPPSAHPTE